MRGLVAICRDVTERKLAEEALRKSEERLARSNEELARSNRELEQFAYVVSHGLRSPLRSIAGFSQILLEDYAERLDEEGRDLLRRLLSSGLHTEQLVEDILNLSRVAYRPLCEERVDLSAIARSIVEERKENWPEREVEFVVEEGLVAEGDPGLLSVLLENLLGNAWKYTHKKSPRARIEFGVTEQEEEGGRRAYFVRDDGAGFDMGRAEGLFEPFRRLHSPGEFEGTGIGLATLKRIVERHGGEVWTEGEVGHGATFYFTMRPESRRSAGESSVAVEAMRAGAHDYVMNNLARLGAAIEREIREAEDRREKRRVERALRESEQQFRATFDLSPVGMAHVAPDGRWLRVNDKLLEILGYEREELLERTFQDVTHPEDLDNDLRYVRRMLKGELRTYSIEKRYIRKDGSRVWICLSVSLVREGGVTSGEPKYFISMVQDITERKLAELIPEPLLPQETEVLKLLMRGETNQQIADKLNYSLGGIKLIVRHVLAKLGVKSREEAAIRAVEIGLLPSYECF